MGRLSWIFRVGPEHHHMYHSKKEPEGNLTHAHRGQGRGVTTKADIRVKPPWPNAGSHQKLERERNGFSLRGSGESTVLPTDTLISVQ